MGHTPTRKGLTTDVPWLGPFPLWERKDGKMVRAKLVRGNDSQGFGTHTTRKGLTSDLLWFDPTPLWGEK